MENNDNRGLAYYGSKRERLLKYKRVIFNQPDPPPPASFPSPYKMVDTENRNKDQCGRIAGESFI